ncbi:MAG: iron complex outermembrane receptor protein [Crocinitomicaceae bacterium]|jgi:iron complex outermembrane receptor protein
MRNILFLIAIAVSFATNAQEGTLTGLVTDNNDEPLLGASVIYRADFTRGDNTDDNGLYFLKLPVGKCRIICRYTSMVTDTFFVNITEGDTVTRNIKLQLIYQEIDDVTVMVGKFDKPLEDQTVSMEILKPEMIENKNTRSIETALDQTPGLNILDGEPQIRGGSGFTFGVGSKVAVIVDDMPMLSGDAGRPEWGFIPVENIHQIEVIKGAASVLSGSSALSGSIHIRTAYPSNKPKTKVNIYSGFYSKPNVEGATWWDDSPLITGANFLHSRKVKNWDIVVGGNLNYDHGYIGPPVEDSSIQASQYADSITNFTNSQMQSKRARVNFNIRHRSKKYRGMSYGLNGNAMISQSNLAFAWLGDSANLFRAYPGAIILQDQWIFHLDPFLNLMTQSNGKHQFRGRMLHSDNQMTANQSNKATTFYGDYMFKKQYKSLVDFDFIGGITGQFINSEANMYIGSGSPNNQFLNVSAYTQLEKKIKKVLNLSVGGRIEYFQLNDSITALKPIFRAGSSLKIYQETYLRASYGQGFRFPTITERYIRTGIGNFGVFPNPDLKPESSWNAEIGVKQGIKIGGVYGYLDLAGFWQEYQNTIEYMFGFWGDPSVPGFAGFKFLNTGESRVLGLDLSFSGKADLGKNATMVFMTGYNYIVPTSLTPDYVYGADTLFYQKEYSYNTTSLEPSRGILKYRFLHNVKADVEVTIKKKFSIGGSVKYFSKIENMDIVIQEFEEMTDGLVYVQDIEYMDFYFANRKGNWIFDARVSYNLNDHHKIAVVGSNITNNVYSLRPLKIEQPRTIMLQYTYSLDKNKKEGATTPEGGPAKAQL